MASFGEGVSGLAAWTAAQDAARAVTAAQHWPTGTLYVAATPIGNLADITLRTLHALQLADTIACEDTRHTQSLLRSMGVEKPGAAWLAVHQHNETESAQHVISRLQQGQRVVYVSDAGTPGISDPGARLCAAVSRAGLPCKSLPGASSVTAALSVAGCIPTADAPQGFIFEGFLPSKAGERAALLKELARQPHCIVLLEAPHRVRDTASALADALGERPVTLARELTKQFEQTVTLPAHDLPDWLAERSERTRGEFVLIIHPTAVQDSQHAQSAHAKEVLDLLLLHLPTKIAVRLCAQITGGNRNALYRLAIEGGAASSAST